MNVPDMSCRVHRKKYEPGVDGVNTCVVVHGPLQVFPWGSPGRLNERLCSMPASSFCMIAVTLAPAGARASV